MNNYLLNRIFLLNRSLKITIVLLIDALIVLTSSYLSLAIRIDVLNLFRVIDERYLISIEYFIIPLLTYIFHYQYFLKYIALHLDIIVLEIIFIIFLLLLQFQYFSKYIFK